MELHHNRHIPLADSHSLPIFFHVSSFHIIKSGGYPAVILDRPAFYDILLKNLPKSKILYGKRVTEIEQDENGATVRCADGRYV